MIISGYTKAAAANWDITFARAAVAREAAERRLEDGVPIELTQREFDALPEYSRSMPTGPKPGFRWRRDVNWARLRGADAEWWHAEAIDDPDPKQVGIVWRPIVIVENGGAK